MKYVFTLIIFCLSQISFGQKHYSTTIPELIVSSYACHFFKANNTYTPITTQSANQQNEIQWMENIIHTITKLTGLQNKIKLISSPGSNNCSALCWENGIGSDRYIIFDRLFLEKYEKQTNKWFVMGVVAHELGHHLNGHTIGGFGSRPDHEIEADVFAGFVLKKLGASKEEAQAIFSFLDASQGPPTHPQRNDRYLAIQRGWHNASNSQGYATLMWNEADNSQNATALYYRALNLDHPRLRLVVLKSAYNNYKKNPTINSEIGITYLQLNQLDSADKYTAMALQQSQYAGLLWYNRAQYYLAVKNDTNAFKCLDYAIANKPVFPEAYYLKAELLLKYQEYQAVLEHALAGIVTNPAKELAAQLYFIRAQAYLRTNQKEAARQNYRQAAKLDPNNKVIQFSKIMYD